MSEIEGKIKLYETLDVRHLLPCKGYSCSLSFCLFGKEMRKKHEDEYMQAFLGISIFYF